MGEALDLVQLDPDHPGFRDRVYRERRNAIARLAIDHREGDPVPPVDYSDAEQEVWRTVWRELAPLHARHACREYLETSSIVQLDRERVPQLSEVNRALERTTGFRMKPVAGLVGDRTFLGHLARGEPVRAAARVVGQLPGSQRRDQRRVPGPDAELAFHAGEPDLVAGHRQRALLGGDDLQRERHG